MKKPIEIHTIYRGDLPVLKAYKTLDSEVIVKLTPEGERRYTMNCSHRDRLNDASVYDFSLRDLFLIFGGTDINTYFVDQKLVFTDNKLEV